MSFEELERIYSELQDQLGSGELHQDEFHEQVKKLRLRDEQGRVWSIGSQSGQWYAWEDGAWVQAQPPRLNEMGGATCPQCGAVVEEGAVFCGDCGQRLAVAGPEPQPFPAPTIAPPPPRAPAVPPPPRASAAPPSPAEAPQRRTLPVALLVGVGLLLCVLVAAGGGYLWWRKGSGEPGATGVAAGTRDAGTVVESAPAQTAVAVATEESLGSGMVTPTVETPEPASPVPSGVQPLVGDWELIEGRDGSARFSLLVEPDGRLRAVVHYVCVTEDWYEDRFYLELEAEGEGRWVGDTVEAEWDPATGETEEFYREGVEVELSADGQDMTWSSAEEEDQLVARRGDWQRVTLRIVNESDTDVWYLYIADATVGGGLAEDEDCLDGILWVDESCRMIVSPGVYDLTATDEDDFLVATNYQLQVDRDMTWTLTGGE